MSALGTLAQIYQAYESITGFLSDAATTLDDVEQGRHPEWRHCRADVARVAADRANERL
jgi:hypothetical protein